MSLSFSIIPSLCKNNSNLELWTTTTSDRKWMGQTSFKINCRDFIQQVEGVGLTC